MLNISVQHVLLKFAIGMNMYSKLNTAQIEKTYRNILMLFKI